MEERFLLDTRDRPRLLLAMMDTLAAQDGRISFEGCLSQTELAKIKGVTDQEDGVLKRATLQPKLDFLVLPLTAESLSAIKRALISKIAFGQRGIIHVQIERGGKMAFAAYDSFHRECVVAYSAVSSTLLDELTKTRVLRTYHRVLQPAHGKS
jgi:hypothetical protein